MYVCVLLIKVLWDLCVFSISLKLAFAMEDDEPSYQIRHELRSRVM